MPLARWSYAAIAHRLKTLFLVEHISPSTIARWLGEEKIKPWRYHTWQHVVDAQAFLKRARPVLRLYRKAQRLLEKGTWVVCVDEKTSIQARAGESAPQPPGKGHPMHIASRYRRQGALHLFAGLSVADGKIYGQCRKRKRFVDFQAFVKERLIPEALRRKVHTLILILDNGTTHAPKRLQNWLKEEVKAHEGLLRIQVYWLPPRASWLNQIEIWFSILQRKRLQPNHFPSLEGLAEAIEAFIAYYNETAKPIRWSYTVEKLEHKLEPRLGMN